MKFENTEVWGFKHALRGMRNPLESWDKSDTFINGNCGTDCSCENCSQTEGIEIGERDLFLMQKLIKAGSEHRKFLRQIFVSVDITAPLYWWKEFDTYKVGTVSNSTSTMHKLASTPITTYCFEMGNFEDLRLFDISTVWETLIFDLERLRKLYNETKDKQYWKELIRLLPESWLQKRTITMNYENILNMYQQRKYHKLTEWSKSFCDWVKTLPYAEELICLEEESIRQICADNEE